jgi:hypothetical protein
VPLAVDPKSREGRAYTNLRALAGARAVPHGRRQHLASGRGAKARGVCARRHADTGGRNITARAQIGAWMEFLAASLPAGIARKSIQFDHNGQPAILMPWPWPPSKDGKVYTSGDGTE